MAQREIFAKHIPQVKLAKRFDADGREVEVERREDADATAKQLETFELLVNAGYYRAKIKGLSAFDKVVGGMTWCIECCDFDVDVDLLFHENLSIGQKIALVEKIVAVLPQMQCPYRIEPHQIQGLEFLSIHPVIQWLVKTSVENREERGQRLKKFAIGQFHNHHQYKTDKENLRKMRNASTHIKRIQELYSPTRQYQRKEALNEDEKTKVRLTLLEYGNKLGGASTETAASATSKQATAQEDAAQQQFDVSQLLKSLSVTKKDYDTGASRLLNTEQRKAVRQHYFEFKEEMEVDAKELSAQTQMKLLENARAALERKIENLQLENAELDKELQNEQEIFEAKQAEEQKMQQQIDKYKTLEAQADAEVLTEVKQLLAEHEQLKKQEAEFKAKGKQEIAELEKELHEIEAFEAQNPQEQNAVLQQELKKLQNLKLQTAKYNRGIVSIQRKIDAIPDRTELSQYQRRFHELYHEMSAKHLETKQYYTQFNTLNDQKRYLEKELSLLNSICEAYNESMLTQHGREEFLKQFEVIVEGVKKTEEQLRQKYNEERYKCDALKDELQKLLDLRRQYSAAVKNLMEVAQHAEQLQQQWNALQAQKAKS